MTFEQAIVTCLRKYATIEGRASRSEYWWFQAFLTLMMVVVIVLSTLSEVAGGFAIIGLGLVLFVPNITVAIRRLHDIGWSGWTFLVVFLPFGSIGLLVLMVLPSEEGANRFGPPPGMGWPHNDGPSGTDGGDGRPLPVRHSHHDVRPSRIPRVPRPK